MQSNSVLYALPFNLNILYSNIDLTPVFFLIITMQMLILFKDIMNCSHCCEIDCGLLEALVFAGVEWKYTTQKSI